MPAGTLSYAKAAGKAPVAARPASRSVRSMFQRTPVARNVSNGSRVNMMQVRGAIERKESMPSHSSNS